MTPCLVLLSEACIRSIHGQVGRCKWDTQFHQNPKLIEAVA
jgi:hypothetical protein